MATPGGPAPSPDAPHKTGDPHTKPDRIATATLLVVNGLILLGPLAFGWNLATLFLIYWLETVFVGLIGLLKIARASAQGRLGYSRSYQAIFFIAHYATFCVLYGTLLRTVVVGPDTPLQGTGPGIALAVVLLFAGHIVSLVQNFFRRKESDRLTSLGHTVVPYASVLPVHAPLVLIGLLVGPSETSTTGLLALVCVKTVCDGLVRTAVHRHLATRPPIGVR